MTARHWTFVFGTLATSSTMLNDLQKSWIEHGDADTG